MQRLEAVHDLQNTIDQVLPFAITKAPERHPATEMRVVIRVASGTTQRAFARNLNGKGGPLPLEDLAPCANNCGSLHSVFFLATRNITGWPVPTTQTLAVGRALADTSTQSDFTSRMPRTELQGTPHRQLSDLPPSQFFLPQSNR